METITSLLSKISRKQREDINALVHESTFENPPRYDLNYVTSLSLIQGVVTLLSIDDQWRFNNNLLNMIVHGTVKFYHQLTALHWCIAFLQLRNPQRLTNILNEPTPS